MKDKYEKPTILNHQRITFETYISSKKECVEWVHGEKQGICTRWLVLH